jgi:HSP20 family protein
VRRTVQLPDTVDSEQIEASFDDGVLTLRLPKKPQAQPRSIEIRVS